MSPSPRAERPHSIDYFGADRDYFWNSDYLDLLASRLDLSAVTCAVDVGCGIGHWSGCLLPRLAPVASITGVDREPSHLREYLRNMRKLADDDSRVQAIQADALSLPLADGSVDLATCQTLLLHLPDPAAAIREMVRVVRPGGLVLCVEPNNLVARLPFSGSVHEEPPERLLRLRELAWRHALGRKLLGKGSELAGELLPGIFAELGLEDIRVWLSDKAAPSIPPYGSPGEQAARAAEDRWREEETGPYDRREMRENALAGGASEAFFDAAWSDFIERDKEIRAACLSDAWSMAGGVLFYVVAGRVPAATGR